MPTPTFTWIAEFGATASPRKDTTVHKFGNSYEQETKNGMNFYAEDWDLQFNARDNTEANALWSFLATNETLSFEWTPPGEVAAKKYKCDAQERKKTTVKFNYNNITAKFRQVFE